MAENKPAANVRILVVDPDGDHAEQLVAGYKASAPALGEKALVPVFADTVRGAQSKLSDRDFAYAAVFVNPTIGSPAWMAVVRTAHQYRAGVPVVLIYDKKPGVDSKQAAQLGLAGAMAKPFEYAKVIELVHGDTESEAIPEAAPAAPPAPPTQSTNPDDFLTVELSGIVGRLKAQFDIYVRLGNGKFVRLVSAGDTISADRIASYRAKGVETLYILKTAQEDYFKFFDSMVGELVKDATVALDVKVSHVANQAKNTTAYLKESGFSEASMQQAQQYVNNAVEMVNQISAKSDQVQKLLNDVGSYEHSLAISTLAGLMLKHIGGENPAILSAIGIACFLHDIALVGQPAEVLSEDLSKMSPAQLQIFMAHPDEGAKQIKKMKNVPPLVAVAVAQHHLRMGKRGFPATALRDDVNRLAELIGMCHEFVRLLDRKKLDPSLDPFAVLRARAAKEFSPQMTDAFIRTFEAK